MLWEFKRNGSIFMIETNIYGSSIEAFSYAAIFIFSNLLPSISMINDRSQEKEFLLVLFINAAAILRENLVLYKSKKVSKSFWFKRFLNTAFSFITLVLISIIIFSFFKVDILKVDCFLRSIENYRDFIYSLCATLLSFPLIIALFEGAKYVIRDYNNNVKTPHEKKLINKYLFYI